MDLQFQELKRMAEPEACGVGLPAWEVEFVHLPSNTPDLDSPPACLGQSSAPAVSQPPMWLVFKEHMASIQSQLTALNAHFGFPSSPSNPMTELSHPCSALTLMCDPFAGYIPHPFPGPRLVDLWVPPAACPPQHVGQGGGCLPLPLLISLQPYSCSMTPWVLHSWIPSKDLSCWGFAFQL